MTVKTFAMVAAMAVGSLLASGVARAGDVEIVNPNTPAAPTVQTAPAAVVPVGSEPAPVEAPPIRERVVHEDVQAPHNAMATIAVSALMGGVVGALVGGSIYFLGARDHAARIGIWTAGGVLLGTGVGVIQVVADESRASTAVSSAWKDDPARTYRLALYHVSF